MSGIKKLVKYGVISPLKAAYWPIKTIGGYSLNKMGGYLFPERSLKKEKKRIKEEYGSYHKTLERLYSKKLEEIKTIEGATSDLYKANIRPRDLKKILENLRKTTEHKKRPLEKLAEVAAIILLLIATAIFISNSNSPTGYAIFSSNILTLNLSPILGILSLIVALILLMNKKD